MIRLNALQGMKMIFRVAVSIMKMGRGRLGRSKFDHLVEVELASKNVHGLLLGGCSPERLIQVRHNLSEFYRCVPGLSFIHQVYEDKQRITVMSLVNNPFMCVSAAVCQ